MFNLSSWKTRLVKKILLLLLILNSIYANSQEIVQRLDPGLINVYQTSSYIPAFGKRILISTSKSGHKSYDFGYGIDWSENQGQAEVWPSSDSLSINDLPYSANSISSITFTSGDMMVYSNDFDCDFTFSEILFIRADRSIPWHLASWDFQEPGYIISPPGMVDKQTFAFLTSQYDTIYVDLNGNQTDIGGNPNIYTNTLIHPDRYLGYNSGWWTSLDTNFQELHSTFIDSIIWVGDLGLYHLVQSDSKLYYLDDDLQVLASNDQFRNCHAASKMGSRLAILNDNSCFVLDSLLQTIAIFPASPQEEMKDILTHDDTIFVLSSYNGIRHSDLLVRKYIINDTLPATPLDISLDVLSIPDTIPVEQDDPPWGSIKFYFNSIKLQISNNSSDTIWNCRVELDWGGIYFCCTYQHTWVLEDMALAPQESKQFTIDTFVMDAPYCGFHTPFCFWIESPNNQPDINPTDNYLCQPAKLVTGEAAILADSDFQLVPNPADQWVYLPPGFYDDVYIFGLDGSLIKHIPGLEDTQIYIGDLPGGIYFLRCSDHQKQAIIRKIVVLHNP